MPLWEKKSGTLIRMEQNQTVRGFCRAQNYNLVLCLLLAQQFGCLKDKNFDVGGLKNIAVETIFKIENNEPAFSSFSSSSDPSDIAGRQLW